MIILQDTLIQIIIMLSTCVLYVNSCGKTHSVSPSVIDNTYGLRYTYKKDNWETHVEGGYHPNGNWRVGTGVKIRFRKREAQEGGNKYNITIKLDPCFFLSYDLNRNGHFEKDEFRIIFGDDEKATNLFSDLDTTPDDGVITEEEFYKTAPSIIADCFNNV